MIRKSLPSRILVKRKPWRYSLRVLLSTLTVACIVCALIGSYQRRLQMEKIALKSLGNSLTAVRKQDGRVDFLALDLKDPYPSQLASDLRSFPCLRRLSLVDCHVDNKLLKELASFKNLQHLYLRNTALDNGSLCLLAELHGLTLLDLGNTAIDSDGLVTLSSLSKLEKLYLRGTRVADSGLKNLREAPKLRWIALDETSVSDDGIRHLAALPALEMLWLQHTQVTDQCLHYLRHAPRLKQLEIDNSLISQTGVDWFGRVRPDVIVINGKRSSADSFAIPSASQARVSGPSDPVDSQSLSRL